MLIVHRDINDRGFVRCPICGQFPYIFIPGDKIIPNDIRMKSHFVVDPSGVRDVCSGSLQSILDQKEPEQ